MGRELEEGDPLGRRTRGSVMVVLIGAISDGSLKEGNDYVAGIS